MVDPSPWASSSTAAPTTLLCTVRIFCRRLSSTAIHTLPQSDTCFLPEHFFFCCIYGDSAGVDNYVHDMQDAGIAIMESMDATIFNNVVENVHYGIRISLGGAGNSIYGNTFESCSVGKSHARLR